MQNKRIYLSWTPENFDIWTVEQDYTVTLGEIDYVVPKGYTSDLTSIPRIFQSILPRWSDYARAALVHDHLYSTHDMSKKDSDRVLFDIMTQDKVNIRQKYLIYWAVALFGGKAWKAQ
jgi:hypothetical protein